MHVSTDRPNPARRFTTVAFLIFIASLGIVPLPFDLLGQAITLSDLIFPIVFAAWLLELFRNRDSRRWKSFHWLLLFFFLTQLLSCIFSANVQASFRRLPAEFYLISLAAAACNLTKSERDLRHAILAYLLGSSVSVIVAFVTIVLFYTSSDNPILPYLTYHYGAVPVGDYPRITTGFVSASMYCNYLNVAVVLALLARSRSWLNSRLAIALTFALVICSVFTISIGLGGMFLSIGAWVWLTRRTENPKSAWLSLAGGATAAIAFLTVSLVPLTSMQPVSGRVLVWTDAFRTFAADPITGHGLGLPVANVFFRNSDGSLSLLTDAHNSFLSIAAQSGILGAAAFLLLVVFVLWPRTTGKSGESRRPSIAAALMLAFFCSAVYQGMTGSFEDARHLWVLMGLVIAARDIEKRPS